MVNSNILEELKSDIVKKKATVRETIKIDEDIYNSLKFLHEKGITMSLIIEEALATWRKKGVTKYVSDIQKELKKEVEEEGEKFIESEEN